MDGTLVAVGLFWLSKSLAYLLAFFNAVLAMGVKAIGSLKVHTHSGGKFIRS